MDNYKKVSYKWQTQYPFNQPEENDLPYSREDNPGGKLSNNTTGNSQQQDGVENVAKKRLIDTPQQILDDFLHVEPKIVIERVPGQKKPGFFSRLSNAIKSGFRHTTEPKGTAKKAQQVGQRQLTPFHQRRGRIFNNFRTQTLPNALQEAVALLKDTRRFTPQRDLAKSLLTKVINEKLSQNPSRSERVGAVVLLDEAIAEVTKKETVKDWKQLKRQLVQGLHGKAAFLIHHLLSDNYNHVEEIRNYMSVAKGIGADLAAGKRDLDEIIIDAKAEIVVLKYAASITPSKTTRKELEAGIKVLKGHLATAIATTEKDVSEIVMDLKHNEFTPTTREAYKQAALHKADTVERDLSQQLRNAKTYADMRTQTDKLNTVINDIRAAIKTATEIKDSKLAWGLDDVKERAKTTLQELAPKMEEQRLLEHDKKLKTLFFNLRDNQPYFEAYRKSQATEYVENALKVVGENIPSTESFANGENEVLADVRGRIEMEKAVFTYAASIATDKANRKKFQDGIKELETLAVTAQKRARAYVNHLALENPERLVANFEDNTLPREFVPLLAKKLGGLDTRFAETRSLIKQFQDTLLAQYDQRIGAGYDIMNAIKDAQNVGAVQGIIDELDLELRIIKAAQEIARGGDHKTIGQHIEDLKARRADAEDKITPLDDKTALVKSLVDDFKSGKLDEREEVHVGRLVKKLDPKKMAHKRIIDNFNTHIEQRDSELVREAKQRSIGLGKLLDIYTALNKRDHLTDPAPLIEKQLIVLDQFKQSVALFPKSKLT